ncbi:peptidylprolyl isomerase [Vitiosangium sp. GDMCC 1.1324]|uniref:peptidylprolyl isomerase n=1 Tax=Vitiosangium sp. (strain GDMCC 1.1324) TaxID=2138576 RepID=UPI000D349AEF|nr:peptidylprolyl isomerase [Vitiosangium sp. GDMCC 1.1324]PTL80713.1 peptidylprolyl isomerase [Vitiosangium sp. GDMCC 1.1324]
MSTSGDSTGNGKRTILSELQGRRPLQSSPGMQGLESSEPAKFPSVLEAPSLEGLEVPAPTVEPLTEDDLTERFTALCRERSARRDRAPGEDVALGDDLLLNVLGYANGKLIPFSARTDWWTEATPAPLRPGFFEALVGAKVGLSVEVTLLLPETYAVESLRGAEARFLVDVMAAREVTLLTDESPELFSALDLGSTLDEVMENIARQLTSEREQQALHELQERVLDELAERTRTQVSGGLIDEEIRRAWTETEYPQLVQRNFEQEELQEALEGWLSDPFTRVDAERRLRISLGLQAVLARDRVEPREEDLVALIDVIAESSHTTREELGQVLKSDPAVMRRFENLALHKMALDHVLSKVKIVPPP